MTAIDSAPILDLIEAFRRSKAMFTAVSLGVFDQLAGGPAHAADLASTLGCDTGSLGRLLDGCVGLGLLSRTNHGYVNTAVSDTYLVSSSTSNLAGYVIYSDRSLYTLWNHLEDAVREGSNRWEQTFGSRQSLFEHFFRTEDSQRTFLCGMHGLGQISSPKVAQAFDLSSVRHVVDLGGATGHFCIAACQTYPELRATVYDLAVVRRFAQEHINNSQLDHRIKFESGDFFSDSIPQADLYYLGRVLHDWDEQKIRRLLSKILAALPSGGAVLIGEALLDDDRSGPMYGLMQSLNMLVCTDGKERTCSEYRSLLESTGFRSVECRRTGTILDAIFARKP
jgi:acetylserotonin N-methyltransferase